ncbi:hypothetical protein PtA15_1A801 [Puccinia triticina]|uniref:Uncharacterized protein n=1 Tax=Puccinia triticina TaxID=208348 RepID=A0ABY7C8G1_9BASI|nr:uncharacterized protein PtA15_1A801 [Puccinia triticina]WAQ81460.1 hypothetical protein PtA15_1A801 [Puccinia triticina]
MPVSPQRSHSALLSFPLPPVLLQEIPSSVTFPFPNSHLSNPFMRPNSQTLTYPITHQP